MEPEAPVEQFDSSYTANPAPEAPPTLEDLMARLDALEMQVADLSSQLSESKGEQQMEAEDGEMDAEAEMGEATGRAPGQKAASPTEESESDDDMDGKAMKKKMLMKAMSKA